MAIYLNKDNKSEIMSVINDHLAEKYDKAGTGLEYVRAKATLTKAIIGAVNGATPKEEFKVLQKHGFTEEIHEFRYSVDDGKKQTIRKLWSSLSRKNRSVGIEFPEHLEVHQGFDLAALINEKKELHSKAVNCNELHNLRRCELGDLSYAYYLRLENYRTVEQLLREYPDMADFIKNDTKGATPSEAERKIAAFNKEA